MRLFDKHSKENESQAKAAIVEVTAKTIAKYIIAQQFLSKSLSGGGESNKNGNCILCKTHKLTRLMAKLEQQVGQLAKTYDLLFGEELDTRSITRDMVAEYYPLAGCDHCNEKRSEEDKSSPMPEDIRDIAALIKHVINDMTNEDIDVQVIQHGPNGPTIFGVNSNDFKNFKDFFKAVVKARKQVVGDAMKAKMSSKESTQEEASIHTATETADSISSDSKSPSSNGSEKGPKRRTSSKNDDEK